MDNASHLEVCHHVLYHYLAQRLIPANQAIIAHKWSLLVDDQIRRGRASSGYLHDVPVPALQQVKSNCPLCTKYIYGQARYVHGIVYSSC